jgi:Fic family protein
MVPSLHWFIYAFVRKEAVLSSQIEGTQATLIDLLTFEAQEGVEQSAAPNADVEEVCNYLDALAYSRAQLARSPDCATERASVSRGLGPVSSHVSRGMNAQHLLEEVDDAG